MDKKTALDKVRARLRDLRDRLRADRDQIVARGVELFALGLQAADVFEELRDENIDNTLLWSQKADDLLDFTRLLPGLRGEILEAIDGLLIDQVLRLFVSRAERRYRRGRLPTIGMIRNGFTPAADLPRRDWQPRPPAAIQAEEPEDVDTALGDETNKVDWGLEGGI